MNNIELIIIITVSTTTILSIIIYYICQYYIRIPKYTIPNSPSLESVSSIKICELN